METSRPSLASSIQARPKRTGGGLDEHDHEAFLRQAERSGGRRAGGSRAARRAGEQGGGPGGDRGLRAARGQGGHLAAGGLRLPGHLAPGRRDERRPADARALRRHGRLPRPERHHDPDPQPRKPRARRRAEGRSRIRRSSTTRWLPRAATRSSASAAAAPTYEVVEDFAILGGTSTNCAGGLRSPHTWITCEEVVKRLDGKKHGYLFEIDAHADGPVRRVPVPRPADARTRRRWSARGSST